MREREIILQHTFSAPTGYELSIWARAKQTVTQDRSEFWGFEVAHPEEQEIELLDTNMYVEFVSPSGVVLVSEELEELSESMKHLVFAGADWKETFLKVATESSYWPAKKTEA